MSNPQVDALVRQISQTLDPAVRNALFKSLLHFVTSLDAYDPLLIIPDISLAKTTLGNYFPSPTFRGDTWNIADWFQRG